MPHRRTARPVPPPGGASQPVEVRRAALGVYVVSVCYLLLALLAVVTRDAAVTASQERETNLTDAEIEAAVNGLVLIAVTIGVAVGLTGIVSAINLVRRRRWARTSATVAVSVALLFSVLGLAGAGFVAVAMHLLVVLSGVFALVFLYRQPTGAYLAAGPAR